MNCKICKTSSGFLFEKKVLGKYSVKYFKCNSCGFIQTESPYWLPEAYSKVIADMDTGIIDRNILLSNITARLLLKAGKSRGKFIDYGGGYGLFVRMMRDKGFDFYYYDKHPVNLFSGYAEHDASSDRKYDLLTSFEVFEHLEDPVKEVGSMFRLSDAVLFTTEIVPNNKAELADWWYVLPETGQHISLYTRKSLRHIADIHNARYTSHQNLHLLVKGETRFELGKNITARFLAKLTRLTTHARGPGINDFESIKNKK